MGTKNTHVRFWGGPSDGRVISVDHPRRLDMRLATVDANGRPGRYVHKAKDYTEVAHYVWEDGNGTTDIEDIPRFLS